MSLSILIVDDDSVDREAIRRALLLKDKSLTLREVSTGQEMLDVLNKEAFDCIFLDYNLPDMDGIHVLRQMYSSERDLGVAPVILLTGKGSVSIMSEALRWGAQDYLIKGMISADTLQISMAKAREVYDLKRNQKQAEELLRQSQKMDAIGQLTSGVSHDFNNLLTVILGNTRLLEKRLKGEKDLCREDLLKKIVAIENSARGGAELIKRLMVFTRQRKLTIDMIDVNECVQDTYEMLTHALGALVEINIVLESVGTWPVEIDGSQMQNALINMAVNARDAMPKGGKLIIETHNVYLDDEYTFKHADVKTGSYVMIAISDTGSGMTEETARRIFEPFFTTKDAGEGTGLGLSMVYGFIRQSGGYVNCYSEVGHGTVFRIYLPRMVDGLKDKKTPVLESHEIPSGNETVLVVDDDDVVRLTATTMLQKLGYTTLEAKDGIGALTLLREEHKSVSLIFTDVVMPGGVSGVDLVKRAREFYPQIKALYTSGYTENAIPEYKLLVGEGLLGKPYRRESLAHKVRNALDQRII